MGSKMEPRWIRPYKVIRTMTKGRVKLKNDKTGKVLSNAYNTSNLKLYEVGETQTPQTHDDCPSHSVSDPPKKSALKRPREAIDNDDITEIQSQTRTFSPLPSSERKTLSTALGLDFVKVVYYGRTGDLGRPRRLYKTKGDGNCYFRAISYILTVTEENHSILREKVIQHMKTDLSNQMMNYLNQNVVQYVNNSRIFCEGVWATDAEIMATANLLRTDIVIYTEVGQAMDWSRYPASFSLQAATKHALYLVNKHNHFDDVISVQL